MMRDFPPIEELLAQAGPMLLLDRVLEHGDSGTRCAVDPRRSRLFQREADRVPAWVALEYMAQCAGVHGSLRALERGETPPPAWFVGSRRLVFASAFIRSDSELEVEASPIGSSAGGVSFACRVRVTDEDDSLAEGRLLVALLRDVAAAPDPGGRI